MSLTVGTDTYVSLADCNTYHTNMGNAAWTGTDPAKEAALRKGTAYLDSHYRGRWKGTKGDSSQVLAWPRNSVLDEDGYAVDPETIPQRVKDACCEAALRMLAGDMEPDLARGGRILSESVGEISVTYSEGAPAGTRYPAIDALLRGILKSGSTVEMIRA